mgnify:FL=1
MLMACHLDGIHPGNAIITMPAVATCILFGTHAVDKPRLIEQSACHLHSLEAVIQHNESDIRSWEPLEYDLNRTYAYDAVAFSPYLTKLREAVREDTEEKIKAAEK